jgi:hypothetical protein
LKHRSRHAGQARDAVEVLETASSQRRLNGGIENICRDGRYESSGETGSDKWKSEDFTANTSLTRRH